MRFSKRKKNLHDKKRMEHIATIKHLYSGPADTNSYVRTWSGTFGDGNVSYFGGNIGNIPKSETFGVAEIKPHEDTLRKGYITLITTEPSTPDCWLKKGSSSNPPLSLCATCGRPLASYSQSLVEPFQPFQGASK